MILKTLSIAILVALPLFLVSCENYEIDLPIESLNMKKVTIISGLTGTLKEKRGNCMPMLDTDQNLSSCSEKAIQDTIVIHELTSWNQLVGEAVFYDSIKSERVATLITDTEGFYEVSLAAGQYSVFIIHNKKYYANVGTIDDVNLVVVSHDRLNIFHPLLDLAVY